MKTIDAAERPPIHMIEDEADKLAELAVAVKERLPLVSQLLLEEITRATTYNKTEIPNDVVTMGATVEFVDEVRDVRHVLQLVYPAQADISQGRISILTPVGAGLIGLRPGQSIMWPDQRGEEHRLTVARVTPAKSEP